jgi:hypothetical protein
MHSPSARAASDLPRATELRYRWHALRRGVSNFALLAHRDCDGFVASMHQSGTHWFKYMLATALAAHYGVPPPRYNHANDLIGGPRDPIVYPALPRLLSSHSIPNAILSSAALHRCVSLPPYVVLVRDIRASLVSNYEKWRARYGIAFAEFLAGDPRGKRFNSDLWWCLRFMNGWGRYLYRQPQGALLLRYEDLQRDPAAALRRVVAFLGFEIEDRHLLLAVASASKVAMRSRHDPAREPGEVREDDRRPADWFGADETAFLEGACSRLLRYGYGYDYEPAGLPRLPRTPS